MEKRKTERAKNKSFKSHGVKRYLTLQFITKAQITFFFLFNWCDIYLKKKWRRRSKEDKIRLNKLDVLLEFWVPQNIWKLRSLSSIPLCLFPVQANMGGTPLPCNLNPFSVTLPIMRLSITQPPFASNAMEGKQKPGLPFPSFLEPSVSYEVIILLVFPAMYMFFILSIFST